MGGAMTSKDVIEFMICGATAVAIGSANFVYPDRAAEIIKDLERYAKAKRITKITDLVGSLEAE
jgi:dihydroorotate dehydrogenase (NAD+) catalytic subunit